MKTLFIVRHAKSSWKHPYLSDFERPLNGRGKRDLPDMTNRFSETDYMVDLMLTSPAARALTTAKAFSDKLNMGNEQFLLKENFYHASTRTIRNELAQVSDKADSVMIFGHNPGLTSLIETLSDFNLYNLPTCAICGICFEIGTWKEILYSTGQKIYYDYPKSKTQ
ncbi:SixA phosphatase family protein [Roseivirga sp.]|uniref:SixA phosphatase family protein n=1 Tax=Roseivirga sp. TaxID=1964215 RepID=UPI003B8ADDF4